MEFDIGNAAVSRFRRLAGQRAKRQRGDKPTGEIEGGTFCGSGVRYWHADGLSDAVEQVQ